MRTAEEYVEAARLAAASMADEHAKRDHYIRRAADKGATSRQIAAAVGLTHAGVAKIINRAG